MNKEIIRENTSSPPLRDASFSGNKQNTGPNESNENPRASLSPLPLAHTPQSVPGLFARTFPLPCLPACPPVSLPSPRASPGTFFEARSEYSDLHARALAGRGEGIHVWLSGTPPPSLK